LLCDLKARAARDGRTLQALVNELLRQGMSRPEVTRPYRLEMTGWKARLQPGVDLLDRDKLFDL
jgi:plasmid stability protein